MRWNPRSAGVVFVVGLGLAGVIGACSQAEQGSGTSAQNAAATDPAAKAERGRYLVELGGCNDCHTPGGLYGTMDRTRTLAGSELGWIGPWGVSFPRNLTPHPENGIGTWTEDDIVKALRTGVRPNGTALQPPMPWPNYVALTDEDAYAIAAYLKSIPANDHKVPDLIPPGQPVPAEVTAITMPPPPAWELPTEGAAAAGQGH